LHVDYDEAGCIGGEGGVMGPGIGLADGIEEAMRHGFVDIFDSTKHHSIKAMGWRTVTRKLPQWQISIAETP
jgi:hypothetical protein